MLTANIIEHAQYASRTKSSLSMFEMTST